jgi:uncharacterized protein YbjT (DUF2867 family)
MRIAFITGGTGYIGVRLIKRLLDRGFRVVALVRKDSEHKAPFGVERVVGNPFDADSFAAYIPKGSTFVQLLGVPRPSPRKRDLFYQIDLPSAKASADAATQAGTAHFVYVSVAQEPSRIMQDYQHVRAEGERYIQAKGLPHTFIRPWYVLGPGHWWPVLLLPVYAVLKWNPATRRKAEAFGLVTLSQMLDTLVAAIEYPDQFPETIEVTDIRNGISSFLPAPAG